MGKRLILLRGLPGSGKTTLGKQIVSTDSRTKGVLLSTNDYFTEMNAQMRVEHVEKAQRWNVRRAESKMKESFDVVVIDDVNGQSWEMLPYVRLAIKYNYSIEILLPDTSWSQNTNDCYRRMKVRIYDETQIEDMAAKWDYGISVEQLLSLASPVKRATQPIVEVIKQTEDFVFSPIMVSVDSPVKTTETRNDSQLSDSYTNDSFSPRSSQISAATVSPLSLVELAYISLVNNNSPDELSVILSLVFPPDDSYATAYQEHDSQEYYCGTQEEQSFVQVNVPSKFFANLASSFGDEGSAQLFDSNESIPCQIPMHLSWELYCCLKDVMYMARQAMTTNMNSQPDNRGVEKEQKAGEPQEQASSAQPSLLDIMEEQQTHQWLFGNKLKRLGLSDITFRDKYRLSLNLLEEQFSSLERHSIEEIFVDNKCNFEVTHATLCHLTFSENELNQKGTIASSQVTRDGRPTFAFTAAIPPPITDEDEQSASSFRKKSSYSAYVTDDRPVLRYRENRYYKELPPSMDFSETRMETLKLQQRKNELADKARELHARGMHTAASYYSIQVRELRPILAQCEKDAALDIIRKRNIDVVTQNYIDLHGLKVREALKALDLLIEQKLRTSCESRYLYAITGTGKHSDEGRAKLRPAVIHYLRFSRKLSFTMPHSSVVKIDLLSSPTPIR